MKKKIKIITKNNNKIKQFVFVFKNEIFNEYFDELFKILLGSKYYRKISLNKSREPTKNIKFYLNISIICNKISYI